MPIELKLYGLTGLEKILGMSGRRIRDLIKAKGRDRLPCVKIGREWKISERKFKEYLKKKGL